MDSSYLRRIMDYDPETGIFRWKMPRPKIVVGSIAGTMTKKKMIRICIDGRAYYANRLAWLYVYGEWPKDQIDHIDLDRTNNRICNLRQATNGQNGANKRTYKNNKCGLKGVRFVPRLGKYVAQIKYRRTVYHLGCFEDPLTAHEVYAAKAREFHGEFARSA